MLKDRDIREALYSGEIARLCREEPASRVLNELGIFQGRQRIDIAVVNSSLHGYEIKSAADRLDRLEQQQRFYSKVFDRITLVADESHVMKAMDIVPRWWGLMVATTRNGKPAVEELWRSRQNQNIDPYALCQLVWREEALALLRGRKMASGLWSRSRKLMWKRLAGEIELPELKRLVHTVLSTRESWKSQPPVS